MSVTVRIPTILRTYTGGAAEVSAEGATLAEVVSDLERNHPGISARVLDDAGKLRRFVNVYVERRRRALRRRSGHRDRRRRRRLDHPGGGRRLLSGRDPPPPAGRPQADVASACGRPAACPWGAPQGHRLRPAGETGAGVPLEYVGGVSEFRGQFARLVRYARRELLSSVAFIPEHPIAPFLNSASVGLLQRASMRIHSAAVDASTRLFGANWRSGVGCCGVQGCAQGGSSGRSTRDPGPRPAGT